MRAPNYLIAALKSELKRRISDQLVRALEATIQVDPREQSIKPIKDLV